jgi:hypothetical protein
MSDLPKDMERELAALADGSLAPERRERAQARADGSQGLRAALAEQRRAVELTAAVEVRAPASLHRELEALLAPAQRHGGPSRRGAVRARLGIRLAGAGALAASAVAVALALVLSGGMVLSGGSSPGLSVQRAAAFTLSPATMAAPVEDEAHRAQLAASVGGVPFPYWKERFGWRGSGARNDRVGGREVTTVFYSNAKGQRIGYAIASGPAPAAHGGRLVRHWGVSYRVLGDGGATVVAWQRDGHLCVVSGRGVSARTLLSLASWGGERRHSA